MRAPVISTTMKGKGSGRLVNKDSRAFNIMESPFGAKIDGVTDDAAACQTLFSILRDGDTVIIPNTGFNMIIKSPLTCTANNINFWGPSMELGTKIDFQSLANLDGLTLAGYGYHMEDLCLISSDNSTKDGLVIENGVNPSPHNCLINVYSGGHGQNGFYLYKNQESVFINCKAPSNGQDGFLFYGSGTGVSCYSCWATLNARNGCRVDGQTGFVWLSGANTSNDEYAFYFENDNVILIEGVDCEGADNGGTYCASTTSVIKFHDIFIRGVAAGNAGFNVNAAKEISFDDISFQDIDAGGCHFRFANAVDCCIGKTYEADETDKQALRIETPGAFGEISFPNFPTLSINFSVTENAATETVRHNIGKLIDYYCQVESLAIETDGGADCSINVFHVNLGVELASLVADANGRGHSYNRLFVSQAGPSDLQIRSQNEHIGNNYRIDGVATIKLIPAAV